MTIWLVLFLLSFGVNVYLYAQLNSFDGRMVVSKTGEDSYVYGLELEYDPGEMMDQKRIIFKVTNDDDDSQTIQPL